tara:strand:+ start:847 stop:1380 length:534 start_codon:yes stop_codon:yes gene_type:complete
MALTKLNSASVIDRLPTGSVIQTVYARRDSTQSNLSFTTGNKTTFEDVGLITLNITPVSTSSTMLITLNLRYSSTASSDNVMRVLRTIGSTATVITMMHADGGLGNIFYASGNNAGTHLSGIMYQDTSFQVTDSPNTTSQINYKMQVSNASGTLKIATRGDNANSRDTTICVQEIKG